MILFRRTDEYSLERQDVKQMCYSENYDFFLVLYSNRK